MMQSAESAAPNPGVMHGRQSAARRSAAHLYSIPWSSSSSKEMATSGTSSFSTGSRYHRPRRASGHQARPRYGRRGVWNSLCMAGQGGAIEERGAACRGVSREGGRGKGEKPGQAKQALHGRAHQYAQTL